MCSQVIELRKIGLGPNYQLAALNVEVISGAQVHSKVVDLTPHTRLFEMNPSGVGCSNYVHMFLTVTVFVLSGNPLPYPTASRLCCGVWGQRVYLLNQFHR